VSARTQARVDEAVPHAARAPQQPAPLRARGEAERRAEHAHEQVAHGDAREHAVDRRAQRAVAAEERERREVVEEAQRADDRETHGHHHVARARERERDRVVVPRRRAAAANNDHAAAAAVISVIHDRHDHARCSPAAAARADRVLVWREMEPVGFWRQSESARGSRGFFPKSQIKCCSSFFPGGK